MSVSFFDFRNTSITAKQARRRALRTRMIRAFPATVNNTEIVSATINGGPAVNYMIDSGATYTILADTTAASINFDTSNPSRQQGVTTVSGQTQANVFNVSFKINDTPAFQTEILVMPSAFNLLSTEDLAKAYTVTLDAGGTGFHLVPLGEAPSAPPSPTPTVQQQQQQQQIPAQIQQIIQNPMQLIQTFLRQLHQALCGGTAKIPFICNNPQTFMISMMLLGLVLVFLILKGMFG